MDWPLRAKMAALLVVASLLPLAVSAFIEIRQAQKRLLANSAALLAARGDQLLGELDTFHRGYRLFARRFAHVPSVVAFAQGPREIVDPLHLAVRAILKALAASDPDVLGLAILDVSGTVRIATEDRLIGKNLSYHHDIREALRGAADISDIHLAEPEVGQAPTIAYMAPVSGPDAKTTGVVVVWVRAAALWNIAKASNELAGPRSFAVVYDRHGIRIAHTYRDDVVFRPGGRLDPATVDALVAERRFGDNTRALLEDVRAFPEQFDRARSASPDRGLFRGFSPVNQQWNLGVARRLETLPWTIFYIIPEDSLNAQVAQMTREKTVFAGGIVLVALLAGTLCAAVILKPIRSLATATASLARGDLRARVPTGHADELGRLGTSFNAMGEQLEVQAMDLQRAHEELEQRVHARTAELVRTTQTLEIEVRERQRAEESLATTLDSIGDAVIATDLDGRVVRMNPVAEQLTGWPLEAAKGRPLAEVFCILDEDTRHPVESPVARVLREGVVVGLANYTVLAARDGTERPIADSGAPIRGPKGEIRGVVLVFRDQTEGRRMEAMRAKSLHLESQNVRIREADRLKSEFLANMSHELRTPLNGIIGFAQLMHDGKVGPVSPDHKEYLGDILTSGHHLLRLINDVLDLAKVESGKMDLRPEPLEPERVIGEVRDILRTLAAQKHVELRTEVDARLMRIVVDPAKLKQVLYNYLSNALKFTPDGGRVAIRVAPEGEDDFRLEVEDTGIGIAAENLPKLFVEFQQLDATLGKKHQGTGLGLALTRKLVEAQGGRVGVRSEPGRGSVFFAILPRVTAVLPRVTPVPAPVPSIERGAADEPTG
jgi:PAS domain S-box-containing protein